jgi:glutathione S-transferase
MKLYQSPASPYARKVRALLIEAGLKDKVQEVLQAPRENTKGFHKKNPLARIPVLETAKGEYLFDSPVICEYLDSLNKKRKLYPAAGAARWRALKLQALGDGIMDAAVPLRQESVRPDGEKSPDWMARTEANILRTVDALNAEARAGKLPAQASIGTLSVACALGYLDFRFPQLDWRKGRAALAKWFEAFSKRPSIAQTVPPAA